MRGGGYGTQDWYNVTKNVQWENTKEILIKREEKKKKGKGEAPGTVVVIDERELLSERLFGCVRPTEAPADFVKKRYRYH
jgi:hypothetical protein